MSECFRGAVGGRVCVLSVCVGGSIVVARRGVWGVERLTLQTKKYIDIFGCVIV